MAALSAWQTFIADTAKVHFEPGAVIGLEVSLDGAANDRFQPEKISS
ncbi:hypothetical protein [Ruegeria atlantica]|nr:hypothetical protein [Ruegeria atlantica]